MPFYTIIKFFICFLFISNSKNLLSLWDQQSTTMRILPYLFLFLLIFIFTNVFAQEEEYSKNSLEVNTALFAGGGLIQESNSSFRVAGRFALDTVEYHSYSDNVPEIQFKYVKHIYKEVSLYTGFYLGAAVSYSSLSLRDSIYVSRFGATISTPAGTTTNYQVPEYHIPPNSLLTHFAIPLGVRLTIDVFNNDKINFSLGSRFTIYPKQKFKGDTRFYSDLRNEEISIRSESSLHTTSKITAGMELDANYQLVSKRERFKFMLGFQLLNQRHKLFDIKRSIESETLDYDYDFSFRGPIAGVYIGTAFRFK